MKTINPNITMYNNELIAIKQFEKAPAGSGLLKCENTYYIDKLHSHPTESAHKCWPNLYTIIKTK